MELKGHIDQRLLNIKTIVQDKPDIRNIKSVFVELRSLIVVNSNGSTLSRRPSGIKSIIDGGKGATFNPPEILSAFKTFFSDEHSTEWASWKLTGINSFSKKGLCPFCAEKDTEVKIQQSKAFIETFDEAGIGFTSKLRTFLLKIEKYIDPRKIELLTDLLSVTADRALLEREFVKLRAEVDYFYTKLETISSFDGYAVDQNNIEVLEEQVKGMKFTEERSDYFNTTEFLSDIAPVNDQIDVLLGMLSSLKGEIIQFQKYISSLKDERKKDINDFLRTAGFNYLFDIRVDGDNKAHAILKYQLGSGQEKDVPNPDFSLSWGERNAFALILFMYDVLSKDSDLIILDDPISSFDSNKKFAIINRLFKTGSKETSLYQRTVLLLSHDFEPIIDYIQVGEKISGDSICAHHLSNIEGKITERAIQRNRDMFSMVVLMKELAMDESLPLPVRVGCLRKFIEHTNINPMENKHSYNILSSLIHGRKQSTYDNEGLRLLSDEDLESGYSEIKLFIRDFCYEYYYKAFSHENLISIYQSEKNGYFKLLILRAYVERNSSARDRLKEQDTILRKCVDETFHIENDYLFSLDVRKFTIVPLYYCECADHFMEAELSLLTSSL